MIICRLVKRILAARQPIALAGHQEFIDSIAGVTTGTFPRQINFSEESFMRSIFSSSVAFLLVIAFVCSPVWATCGGGGGGGGGGTSGGGGSKETNPVVYHVPWKTPAVGKSKPAKEGLVLYWFPASKEEMKISPLKESRNLSLYAGQCVSMQLGDNTTENGDALIGESPLPVAVLATPEGMVVSKVESLKGKLKLLEIEKLVAGEIKQREAALDAKLKDAKAKATVGDNPGAVELYKAVAAEKCMFAKKAKTAASELKKLGANNIGSIPASPNFNPKTGALIVQTMKRGLIAENKGNYLLANKYYSRAHRLDPADATPLRYLAELQRHHIGDWDKAKVQFNEILDMPNADPLSRAVAFHGLGKITIHEGEFKKGLHLMEQSVEEFPIALAYRNLAVYWNSEYELAKANEYTDLALAMDPKDPYNLVFAAVYMAMNGKKDEALKIAKANINLMPASYNLAAIFAQNGQRDKALELLKRHFYQFERFHAVREKEMMEARVDAVFDSIRQDADFLALTKLADGKLPMVMSPSQTATPMRMDN
ncbi:MAG: tetratricopeptide repeat protein [Pyrinomonadaceae bacterium]